MSSPAFRLKTVSYVRTGCGKTGSAAVHWGFLVTAGSELEAVVSGTGPSVPARAFWVSC